jgi:hypothetical protein
MSPVAEDTSAADSLAAAEVLDHISPDRLAERRIRALARLVAARREQDAADEELILCDLADDLPSALAAWQTATAAREAAEAVPEVGQGHLRALQARLSRLEERAAEAKRATEIDGLDDYLASNEDTAVNARRDRLALEEEIGEVRQRIGAVGNVLSPPLAALRDAQHAETVAKGRYELILQAAADPLGHRRARDTDGYGMRMARIFPEVLAAGPGPDWPEAVAAMKAALRISGIGEQVQVEAIAAYAAGDPAARAIGTGAKRLPGGQTVITEPGKPPVVYQGRASAGELAAAPGLPQGDGRTGAQVSREMWGGT